MNDHESQAVEELLAAESPATANAGLVDAAKKAVAAWSKTRTTSIALKGPKDKTRKAAPKDLAFKALTTLVDHLAKAKLDGPLLVSARQVLPYLKRSSGAHEVNAKQARPLGSGR
jgi:hypothetical protein